MNHQTKQKGKKKEVLLTISSARNNGEVLSPEAVLCLPEVDEVLRLVADGEVAVVDQVILQPSGVAEPDDGLVPRSRVPERVSQSVSFH